LVEEEPTVSVPGHPDIIQILNLIEKLRTAKTVVTAPQLLHVLVVDDQVVLFMIDNCQQFTFLVTKLVEAENIAVTRHRYLALFDDGISLTHHFKTSP